MDRRRVANNQRQSKPSGLVDHKSTRPIPLGIFQDAGSVYQCLICTREFVTLESSVSHSRGRTHMESFTAMKNCCQNTVERFTCKLCNNHTAADWDSFLFHFHSENHFKDKKFHETRATVVELRKRAKRITKPAQISAPTYSPRLLQENYVIGPSRNGTYYCKLCGCTCQALLQTTQHISGKQHKYFMELEKEKELNNGSEETESSLSNCDSSDSWERYDSSENPSDSDSFDTSSSDSWETTSSWETVGTESLPSESGRPKLLRVPNNLIPLIAKHLLQHREKEIYCPACDAHIKDPKRIVDHVESRKHIGQLSRYRAKVAPKPKDRAATLERNKSSGLDSKLASDKKASASSNPKSEAGTSANQPEIPKRKLIDIPAHLSPLLESNFLIKSDYAVDCPACGVRLLHMNNVHEHIKGRNHKAMLKVYKSKQDSTAVHKSPQVPQSNQGRRRRIRRGEGGEGDSNPKTLKIHSAVYTRTQTANKKQFSTESRDNSTPSTSSTNNALVPSFGLMSMPEVLVPLIAMHSLRFSKNEIYCPACDVTIRNASTLVNHTNGRRHTAELKKFRNSIASKNMPNQTAPRVGSTEAGRESDLGRKSHVNKMEQNRGGTSKVSHGIIDLEKIINKLTIADGKDTNSTGYKGNNMQQQDEKKMNRRLQRAQNFKNGQSKQEKKPQTQNNKRINGRSFDPKYLKVEMEYIYEVHPEKMRIMMLSCQLCFPSTSSAIYCLICEKSVPSESQTFYDHICSVAHTQYLADAEKEDKLFIPYPEQFSDLSLAKEFMQQTSAEEIIQCLACDANMDNDDVVISKHIELDSHKEAKRVWNYQMEKILQDVLAKTKSTWYNIQKYWCQPCDAQFNTEFNFAEHIDTKKHSKSLKKIGTFKNRLVYDACIPCATLWLGFSGLYPQHCDQPMHKYLMQTGDYFVCTLPRQVKTLLENSEAEVEKLIKLSDQVSTVQKVKADNLLKCLEDTVEPAFPYAKAHPFGSRVSGLGFPDSDIDVFLDCGTYNGVENIEELEMEILVSVENCLYANQRSWEIEETLTSSRTPIIKLRHRSTELRCDVSFKNGLSVENTRLLKCFMDNYPLCRKLMLFIKKWLNFCNLAGSQYITNYAICWCIIFYLQSKSVLPSVASMIAKENKSKIIDGWETGICETFDKCEEEFTFTELLHGFFDFYSNFDYRYSVACPIIGSTIPKQDFTELHLLPKEMEPYVNRIKTKGLNGPVELFRIDSEMCIQDPYDLSHNLTKAVRKFTLNRFKQLCAASADVLINFKQH